jgi:carbon-monoxide dehydrogenase medium subunit/xanthine dehydrogenase FAD-binding subunit
MQKFQFHTAQSIDEALNFLSQNGEQTKIIAGGTDLIPLLRNENLQPAFVLNILEIGALRRITEQDRRIRIGPTTTFTDIAESPILARHFPSLVQAASSVGGPQLRNRGTIGGNIGTASPAADVLPAVLALDGELELQSKRSGTRYIPLSRAISAPYKPLFQPDEILTGILLQKLNPETRCAFVKIGRRNAMARARMNLSVVLRLNPEEVVSELRIVPGAVMPVAKRMERAERVLLGRKVETSFIEAAGEALSAEMVEVTGIRWSTEYKVPVLQNLFKEVLRHLIA